MKPRPPFPKTYENTAVRRALESLAASPSLEGLEELMAASVKGALVVDVTGSTQESGTRVRTIESTDGRLVLPLFTSMRELETAVGETDAGTAVQAIVIPAREALALITTADFAAVQFNPGSHGQVVAREHVEAVLDKKS
ncbi:SseB family protein [Rathayibacter sp. CAU 1779]